MAKLPTEKILHYESKDGLHVTVTDMGELVRCKDCVYYRGECYCRWFECGTQNNGYCHYGERKEE